MKNPWKPGNGTIALILACLTAIILTATAPAIGLTTDEPAYIVAADSYARWFYLLVKEPGRALNPAAVTNYWMFNHEHPPVEKIWSGLVWLATRHFFDEPTANRIGPILLVAFLVALLYLMVVGTYGKTAGLFAAAALLSLPRFFLHAHLVALDVPVAVASFATIFLFWKTVDRKGWAWGLLWGLAWGLAVAVKLNGVFISIALVMWFLIFRRNWSVALRLLLMVLVALLTFFMVWPWLYYQTWPRLIDYVNFHLHHYMIGQWYFGQFFMPPPWHFIFVMVWAVVPLTVMILSLVGIIHAGKEKRDGGLKWLLILSVFVSISPFIFGKSLLYDNERLFMPVFPFLAALAGIGFGRLVTYLQKITERVKRPALAIPAAVILGIALLMPQVVTMTGLYPYLLSYYSEGVGGLRGAKKLGLETTYWCNTCADALPYINIHAEPGDIIWSEDSNMLHYYQTIGQLRQDVLITDKDPVEIDSGLLGDGIIGKADWYIFQYRQTQYGVDGEKGYLLLRKLATQTPVYEVSYQGVPLMKLYGALK
jgi:4-amino-4-deoxy-L-arabinose transferase-like glycosyltransferase